MIRVRIEMCPRGDERPEAVREIGRMYIANTGGDVEHGDYTVGVCRRGSIAVPSNIHPRGTGPKPTRSGTVEKYPRLAYNVWRLIARACLATFPEEAGSRTAKGVSATLDGDVMHGLGLLADFVRDADIADDHNPLSPLCNGAGDADASRAALAWLEAAKADA